jgi:hypothetical protein
MSRDNIAGTTEAVSWYGISEQRRRGDGYGVGKRRPGNSSPEWRVRRRDGRYSPRRVVSAPVQRSPRLLVLHLRCRLQPVLSAPSSEPPSDFRSFRSFLPPSAYCSVPSLMVLHCTLSYASAASYHSRFPLFSAPETSSHSSHRDPLFLFPLAVIVLPRGRKDRPTNHGGHFLPSTNPD